MSIPEIIATAKDLVIAFAASITALVALLGIRSWRTELRGKSDFEAARNLARASYNVRDTLQDSRSPMTLAGEFPPGYSNAGKNTPEAEANAYNHIFRNRFNPVIEAVQNFDTHVLEAEALWGSDIKVKTEALRKCAREVQVSMKCFVDDKLSGGEDFRQNKEWAVSVRSDVHASITDEENEMNKKIQTAISDIESYVRPYLQRN